MKRATLLPLCLLLAASCSPANPGQADAETFVVASTTSTQDSGLLDAIAPAFEKAYPQFRAKVVAVGSGEAIDLGRRGDADVLLVHSPDDEKKFMEDGRGVFRRQVMRNDFVIAGPAEDPASIKDSVSAAEAFKRIAGAHDLFLSRGDQSGTHKKELKVWERAGISPSGPWYLEAGQGMAETLTIASEKKAYVLTDTATLTVKNAEADLVILFRGDPVLVNPYSVIPVKGARHPQAALAFANWITGKAGQNLIANFGRNDGGAPLFVPAAG